MEQTNYNDLPSNVYDDLPQNIYDDMPQTFRKPLKIVSKLYINKHKQASKYQNPDIFTETNTETHMTHYIYTYVNKQKT